MSTAHAYQLQNTTKGHLNGGTTDLPINNSLSVNGLNEKLIYKNTNGQQQIRGANGNENSGNGYLIKSAQNAVKQMHH